MLRASRFMPGLVNRQVILLGCLVVVALAAAGYEITRGTPVNGAQAATPSLPPVAQTEAMDQGKHDRLQLLVAGFPRPLLGPVPVSGDLSAEIVETGGGHGNRQLQVSLRRGEPGVPVSDANIVVDGNMVSMGHDSFRVGATSLGGGEYLIVLPFTMDGQWDVMIALTSGDSRGALNLSIDVGGGS